jgi:RNA polymerase sigma factor for flagellar operon FliA
VPIALYWDMAEAGLAPLSRQERDRILIDQLPQVHFIARRISERLPQHVEIDDLISAGYVGLIDAVKRFDPAKNVQFKTYAQFRIRGAILDSLRELDWSPRELRQKARSIEDANRRLSAKLGCAAGDSEIAKELGLSLAEYQGLLNELQGLEIGSLHAPLSTEDGAEELLEYVPDPGGDPLCVCLESEMKAHLAQAVANLPDRERHVMALYYFEELTMKEIGEVLEVGESRVSQIHTSAVLRIRAELGVSPRRRKETKASMGGKVTSIAAVRQGQVAAMNRRVSQLGKWSAPAARI